MKGDFTRSTFSKEKHYSGVRMQQGRVQLDADWNEQLDIGDHQRRTTRQDVIGPCGAPKQNAGFVLTIDPERGLPVIGRGRYYIDGILCENEQDTLITAQPDLPGFKLPESPEEHGTYLAYLEVWQRHITAFDDPGIREAALGGPDTATRTKTIWQVNLEKAGSLDADVNCSQFAPGWLPAEPRSTGRLRARTQREVASDGPCILPPQAGYRRLENQLYRVEIHDGGEVAMGSVTFKWSRDNGSLVTRLEKPTDGKILTVTDSINGGRLPFAVGQWVELSDEPRVLRGEPGVLVQLAAVEGKRLTVVEFPGGSPPELDLKTATVRCWDSPGAIMVTTESDLDLEDGVQVSFLDGHYVSGDCWMIPARTNLSDVLWPVDPTSREPLFQTSHGIEHHYCALALMQFDGAWAVLPNGDCRRIFPALTEPRGQKPAIRITAVLVKDANDADTPLRNDTEVPVDFLARGIRLECDHNIDPNSLGQSPTCFVTLEMPFPFNQADKEAWGNEIVGFQPLVLAGQASAENTVISWTPANQTAGWLERILSVKIAEMGRDNRVLSRLTLKGNFIWAMDQPEWYLDGGVLGIRQPDGTNTDSKLPSGGGGRSSDFEMWFWLVPVNRSAPRINVRPQALQFDPVRIGATATSTLTLRNNGNAALTVKSISIQQSRAEFSVTQAAPFTIEPQSEKALTVQFTPASAGSRAAQLIIASNDPGSPTVLVHISGEGIAVPHLAVDPPEALAFGSVIVGSPKDLPLTVQNTGDAPLEVTRLSITQTTQAFTILDRVNGRPLRATASFTLGPGQKIELGVRFIPTATASQIGLLTVRSNDPDNPTVTIRLSGRGVRMPTRGTGGSLPTRFTR